LYLVYTDETGTNFSEKSPYLLYGGLVVHESKVNILESQLEQIIAKFLKIDDIRKVELHTSEIFTILFHNNVDCNKKRKTKDKVYCQELKELLKDVSTDDFINFTNELIQFLTKMNVPLMVGVVNKNDKLHKKHRLNKEVSAIAYSFKIFLNLIDRFMASKNEKALLIADDFSNQIPHNIASLPLYKRITDENIKSKNGARKELVLLRVFHESMNWKSNLTSDSKNIAPLKYEFESKNLFIVDNINYTNSQDSILNQVADFMLFILRKVFEINNSDEKIQNENILKLVKEIDSSLLLSMNNNDIQLVEIKDNDIYLLFNIDAQKFKEVCNHIKRE